MHVERVDRTARRFDPDAEIILCGPRNRPAAENGVRPKGGVLLRLCIVVITQRFGEGGGAAFAPGRADVAGADLALQLGFLQPDDVGIQRLQDRNSFVDRLAGVAAGPPDIETHHPYRQGLG